MNNLAGTEREQAYKKTKNLTLWLIFLQIFPVYTGKISTELGKSLSKFQQVFNKESFWSIFFQKNMKLFKVILICLFFSRYSMVALCSVPITMFYNFIGPAQSSLAYII